MPANEEIDGSFEDRAPRQPTASTIPKTGAAENVGRRLASGAFWTMVGYGCSQVIRFATSMALTRLLAPELFGIMLIANTIRTGAELLSDVGIGQSLVRSPHGEEPTFRNTAWTLQVARGVILSVLCGLIAIPVSAIYDVPVIAYLLPVAALTLLIAGFTSMSLPLLRRRMAFRRLAIFEVATALIYSAFQIAVAYVYPTVWALVIGLLFGSLVNVAGSFLLAPVRHGLRIDKSHLHEILSFGKWITGASAIYFVTTNFDRLYFPGVLALEVLGVFAIARTITDIGGNVFVKLNNSILFPYVASRGSQIEAVRHELRQPRARFVGATAVAVGMVAGSVDILVTLLFDPRYEAAGWMASILVFGTWFGILAGIAEASLMGLGRPQVTAFAHGAKLTCLVVALPLMMSAFGLLAAIATISVSEIVRYLATVRAQTRASISFLVQDGWATAIFLGVTAGIWCLRSLAGLPMPAPSLG